MIDCIFSFSLFLALDCDDCEDEDFGSCPNPGLLFWVQDTQVVSFCLTAEVE